ncbi:ScyD/ScyE family protein [Kineococcus arenarius]|uniref:ScyD/ScyE family protein n=1 Tax=Kineococcus sp. SYSU DK007 TaxID=3383128 RepID=UPI003D7D1FE9
MITIATVAGLGLAAPAGAGAPAHHERVEVVAQGLDDPFGLSYRNGKFYVAESTTGEISGIIPGGRGPVVRVAGFPAPAGVDRTGEGLLVVTGEGEDPGASTLYLSKPGVGPRPLADLAAYELAENPDGQRQFGDDGAPLDALSNPFAVLGGRGHGAAYAYVADAGANAVLAVDRHGTVSTFFVPDVVTTGPCEGVENNDPEHAGCDPVPTGLAWGPDGNLYVSGLAGEAPGEGRVYVLDPGTGELLREITGLDAPTGVAVGDDGEVYVSEVLEGAPPGEPEPGFDPSTVGRIVRVDVDGSRSVAQVPTPLGLRWAQGALHATAWSVAGAFLGQGGLGQVVRVDSSAFTAED